METLKRKRDDSVEDSSSSSSSSSSAIIPVPSTTVSLLPHDPPGAAVNYNPRTREFDWRITISNPHTFKTLLVIIYRVLSQCSFQLYKTDEFTGLRVDSMDSSMVCMIKAMYECNIETHMDLTDESFCIVTDTFNTLLKDVQPGHVLLFTRYSDSAELTIDSYMRDDSNNRSTCTLNIIEDENNAKELRMNEITYKYVVEMDLTRLKSCCKMAQDINSSHIEIRIEQPHESSQYGSEHLFFTVGASSDIATFKKTYYSLTTIEDKSDNVNFTVSAISSDRDETVEFDKIRSTSVECYNEVFSTNYLNLVLKSMDRQTVQLYMSEKTPLIIRYSLGSDLSYIQIILAPRVRDENE